MRVHLITTTAVVVGALLLSGCSAPVDVDKPTPAPTAVQVQVQERPEGFPLLGTSVGGDKADFQSQQAAVQAAEDVMTAFVTHDREYDAWWADLSPLLTVEAREAWSYTDPRLIPVTQLTGPATVVNAPSSTLVIVDVPTDTGLWRLELVRTADVGATEKGAWKAFTLMPPETTDEQFVG